VPQIGKRGLATFGSALKKRIDKDGHIPAAWLDAVVENVVTEAAHRLGAGLRDVEIKCMPAGAQVNPGQPIPLKQAVFMAAHASPRRFYAL
jgi:hypothetical protein